MESGLTSLNLPKWPDAPRNTVVDVDWGTLSDPFILITELLRNGTPDERAAVARAMTAVWGRSQNTDNESAVDDLFSQIFEEL